MAAPVREITAGEVQGFLRAGDRILVAQGSGEPSTIARALATADVAGLTACVGLLTGDALLGGALAFESYGALGLAARIPPERLVALPLHYSDWIRRLVDGRLPVDVVALRLSPARGGRHYLGLGDLHLIEVARRARLVLAEICDHVPSIEGSEWPADLPVVAVPSDTPPPGVAAGEPDEVERAIAGHVAALVPERAVLQLGVGRLPQAVTAALTGHRDLGVHSGAFFDGLVDLYECGAITNAHKEVDRGHSVTTLMIGGARLMDFAKSGAPIRLCRTSHTHSPSIIAALSRFHAINSAVEVDLTGQINAETAGNRIVGGIGGQVDFARGALASPGGHSIVALPSTARGGTVSRIVAEVATVSASRSDADVVVTEWGVAELAGVGLDERARRLIAIAHPAFRDDLARTAFAQRRTAIV